MSSKFDGSALLLGLLFSLLHSTDARNATHFERRKCADYIVGLQSDPGWSKNNATYFAGSADALLNGSDNMTVTLRGCEEFCGPRSWYWDAGPRITTWIIPVLLLLSNIELSPIDKKRFMTIIHALGDPIDSFWSIIHKMYIWHRLYEIGLQNSTESLEELQYRSMSLKSKLRINLWKVKQSVLVPFNGVRRRLRSTTYETLRTPQRKDSSQRHNVEDLRTVTMKPMSRQHRAQIIATVLSGFEEISGSKIKTELHYHMIIRKLLKDEDGLEDRRNFEEWRKCARVLADARTNEYLRTCLAIAVYFLGLIAAFVPSLGGGNTSPPGGRIGSALFLSWLVPLALLSNRMGAFTSRRACLHIMKDFVTATTKKETSHLRTGSDVSNISPTQASGPCFMMGDLDSKQRARGISREGGSTHAVLPEAELNTFKLSNDDAAQWAGDLRTQMFSASSETAAPLWGANQYARHEMQDEETDLGVTISTNDRTPLFLAPGKDRVHHIDMEMKIMKPGKDRGPPQIITDPPFNMPRKKQVGLIRHATWDEYFSSLQWLGAIYTYRPWKVQYKHVDHRTHAKRNNGMMALAGLFPVLVSAVGASAILWYAVPIGFSCRSVWVVVIFGLWIVSAMITTAVYVYSDRKDWVQEEDASRHGTDQWQPRPEVDDEDQDDDRTTHQPTDPERKLWLWILTKDALIAAGCVVTIFLSTAGIFNSCYCWSVYMTMHDKAVVPLATDKTYEERAVNVYSGIVITCIGVKVIFFFTITSYWNGGLRLVRWHENEKREEWAHESEETVKWTAQSRFLFWYYEEELEMQEDARKRSEAQYQLTRRPTFIESNIRGHIPWIPGRRSQSTAM